MPTNGFAPKVVARKPQYIRTSNSKAIMAVVRGAGSISIPEISQRVKLSKTTVSKIVLELVAKGVLIANGKGDSTEEGGKKPELFSVNANHKYAIVVGLESQGMFKCVLFDMVMRPQYQMQANEKANMSYQDAVLRIADMCHEIIEKCGVQQEDIWGIVCHVGGVVDEELGLIRYPISYKHWGRNVPLREDVKEALGFDVQVILGNGSRMAGYAEMNGSVGEKFDSYAVIFSNADVPGVGGCVVQKGRVQRGENGYVGEFGHMVVDPHLEEQCACGNYGCLEMAVSPHRILAMAAVYAAKWPDSPIARRVNSGQFDFRDVFTEADEGDELARFLVDYMVPHYVTCVRNIILSFDPQVVVMQGLPLVRDGYFLRRLNEQLAAVPFFGQELDVEVVPSDQGQTILELFFKGAALYAFNEYFNSNVTYTGKPARQA